MQTNSKKHTLTAITAWFLALSLYQIPLSCIGAEENLAKLKPEDWVKELPAKAQADFIQARAEANDDRRLMAMRSWSSIWRSKLKEPYGTLVDLDYMEKCLESKRASFEIGKQIASERQELTEREGVLSNVAVLIRTIKARSAQDGYIAGLLAKRESRLERATEIARRSKDQLFNWQSKWGYSNVPHPEDWKKKTKRNPHWYWPK